MLLEQGYVEANPSSSPNGQVFRQADAKLPEQRFCSAVGSVIRRKRISQALSPDVPVHAEPATVGLGS